MKIKTILLLVLLVPTPMVYADDAYNQLIVKTERTDKRLTQLEKTDKQTNDRITALKKRDVDLDNTNKRQQETIAELSKQITTLQNQTKSVEGNLTNLQSQQTTLDGSLRQLGQDTALKTKTIDQTITTRSMWYVGIIVFIFALFVAGYWYLRRRGDASEKTLGAQVKNVIDTVRSSEEKIAKADTALADSLLDVLNKLKLQDLTAATSTNAKNNEPDHNLPLKLADEIHRMRKRLASLPEETKGLTPLKKSLERLEAELADQGYEIVDHTGMAYTENLSVKARFIPSDDLGVDQKIITKVVTPHVNYKGVMIRMADIEVSIGS